MADYAPWYLARESMVDAVISDLYGTAADEVLSEPPLDRYIVGIIHPRAATGGQIDAVVADEVPEDASATPEAGDDPGVSFAHLRYPSSIGLTFGLGESTRAFEVEVEACRYLPEAGEVSETSDRVATRGSANRDMQWSKVALGPSTKTFGLGSQSVTETLDEGLELRVVTRSPRESVVSVTVVLVNRFTKPEKAKSDEYCWFRPVIRVRALGGEFLDRRPATRLEHLDEDELSGELLYRRERHLAVGHGVAVTWAETSNVTALETTFFPQHDLPLAKAERKDVTGLTMTALAGEHPRKPLDALVDTYENWLTQQRNRLDLEIPALHRETGQRHLEQGAESIARMRRGIDLLTDDPTVGRAFQVMNLAMQEQRVRQEMVRQRLSEPPAIVGEWRPFQIGFILLNLAGLADPESEERDIADLLWFPTGGGKTEAYLGLIAFILTLRRLRGEGTDGNGAGVGVIMRYTLRLLTLQQFERAAGLICALQDIRDREPDLATKAPFSIGLWVGQGATPNNVDNAAKALRKKRDGEDTGDLGDPVQLLHCPWCGSDLDVGAYEVNKPMDTLEVKCPSARCRFRTGLPVHLVDSDVYGARPSLVIGTVDKFAMLAWNEKSGRLFGLGPDAVPDLIIQDELHLISGPLGTLVGLYETAVDHLATSAASARPKLIASTATIRRAEQQVRAVFARESRQFPPPGLDSDDSFFAVDAEPDEKGTRRYVGLMAPSASHATLLVRTYAATLQAGKALDATNDVRDAYWTLLGYFNSLRVLGAAFIQSIDDVRDRIKVVATRTGNEPRITDSPRELTSRIKSSEVPNELKRISKNYPDTDSPDIVLATNMISVGVDIDRLGLMAVMGQPQTTSEYIQATSRVGRKHPGLVFSMYNASRSRDLSHYEGFTSYHRALYKQVEATGATPFAARALDRGLHGLLVILARHTIAGAAGEKAPTVPVDSEELQEVIDVIVKRVSAAAPRGADTTHVEREVEEALAALVQAWTEATKAGALQKYGRWMFEPNTVKSLMVPAGASSMTDADGDPLIESFPPTQAPWPTLTSLRNVDRESTLKIISSKRKKVGAGDGIE